MSNLIDLHIHSTASDGSLTPSEVVLSAKKHGLCAIALTDHDTLSGLDEAEEKAAECGIEFIRGCELSAKFYDADVHILGLFVPKNRHCLTELEKELQIFIDRRNVRNKTIVEKLQGLGIDITLEEVEKEAGGKVIARPHFATVLLRKNVIKTPQEAFTEYLGKGKKAYVPRESITPHHAVSLLAQAKAVPVLAHPGLINCGESELTSLLKELIPLGLKGIEVYHSAHSFGDERKYLGIADELGLCVSGGSDFHGRSKPDIEIGKGKGSLRVPACILDAIKKHIPPQD